MNELSQAENIWFPSICEFNRDLTIESSNYNILN